MKSLTEILSKPLRIIEFSKKRGFFPGHKIFQDKFLSILKIKNNGKILNNELGLKQDEFIQAIARNSSDIIILSTCGFRELQALYRTSEASYFYVRITAINFFFITYFFIKNYILRRFRFNGTFYLRRGNGISFYLGLCRKIVHKRTRHYLSPLVKIEDFFELLNDQGIKYCVLRWFDNLPEIQSNEDVDLLVDDEDLDKLHSIIDARPGTIPFDIYSKTGKPGSDFQSLPYYMLPLAEKALSETVLLKNKFKVPTQENYFYLLAYHAVFHKGEKSGLISKNFDIKLSGKTDHDYLAHLKTIAREAGLTFDDFTLDALHSVLESKGFAPPVDTLYKLSLNNEYLKAYLNDYQNSYNIHSEYEGLVCFVAREEIIKRNLLDAMVNYIKKEGFTILKIKSLEEPFRSDFTKHVRGGNWNQGPWPVSGGLPAVVIVALDVYPVEPKPSDFELHPGLSNRRIISKNDIRDSINKSLSSKSEWFNGIHSSDNEIQALEYISLAGINEIEILSVIQKHLEMFETKFPILGELSQYSKRAKVELIDYHGSKAVKKTFKPGCEIFLENEIKALNLFKELFPVPMLLETGNNYLITGYIEDNQPFARRINFRSFKKCLEILRNVYNEGYSLLDFKPENFLLDGTKNIYLTDFEFLYKYDVKPEFLDCYDLVGAPKNLDRNLVPTYFFPDGVKQFDSLWYTSTGIKYEELAQINSLILHLKSMIRINYFRAKDFASKIAGALKRIIKNIFKYLP